MLAAGAVYSHWLAALSAETYPLQSVWLLLETADMHDVSSDIITRPMSVQPLQLVSFAQ